MKRKFNLLVVSLFITTLGMSQIWLMDGNGCRFFDQYEQRADEIIIEWDGGCRDGYLTGKGTFKKYKSGQLIVTFVGELELGKYKNNVSWSWPDGNSYVGEIKNSNMTGKGKFTWANGNVYEGDFVNGERTGKGKYTFANGEVYNGDFIKGIRTGKGKMTYLSGDVYDGDFVNNKYHGWGKLTYAHGDIFEGEFRNGLKSGQGKYDFANSTTYVYHKGVYRNDKKNGPGKLFYPDGTFIEAFWTDDQMSTKQVNAAPERATGSLNQTVSEVKYSNYIYGDSKPKPAVTRAPSTVSVPTTSTTTSSTAYNNNSNPNNRPQTPVVNKIQPKQKQDVEEINSNESETEIASISGSVVPSYKWEFLGYWTTLDNGQYKRTVNIMKNGLQHKSGSIRYVFNNEDNTFYIDVVGLEKTYSFLYKPEVDNSLKCVGDRQSIHGIKDLEGAFFQAVQYTFTALYR